VHEHEDRIFRATIFRFRAAQAKSMGRPLFTREEAKSDPMETSWVTGGILELCPPPKRVRFAAFWMFIPIIPQLMMINLLQVHIDLSDSRSFQCMQPLFEL
jgi:hypothetical protein